MLHRCWVGLLALAAVAGVAMAAAQAQDAAKYPDWSGKWRVTGGNRWDPTKPGRILQWRQRRILRREQNAHFPEKLLR